MASNQNVSVYLDQELADEVEAAVKAGKLDKKEVVKAALRAHLHPEEGAPDSQGDATADTTQLDALREQLSQLSNVIDQAAEGKSKLTVALGITDSDPDWDELAARAEFLVGVARASEEVAHPLQGISVSNEGGIQSLSRTPDLETVYELSWASDFDSANAKVEVIKENGGWVQSVAPDADGNFLFLIAWPQR